MTFPVGAAPTQQPSPQPSPPPSLGTAIDRLRHRWGWFIGFGALVAFMGLLALGLVVSATIASVFSIAIFMIIAGGTEIAMGLSGQTWSRFFLLVIAGLLYVVGGAFALAQPLLAAAVFTLMLGIALLVTGCVRIYIGAHIGKPARTMVILAGIVTALVGLFIILGWPTNSFFILGILLGLDLFFWGASWIGFGLRLRAHGRLSPP